MTPAEQRAEELAKKFGTTIRHPLTAMGKTKEVIHENGYKIEGFSAGFLAFKDQPEVFALITSLESIVIGQDNLDRLDEVDCKTRKMLLIHMSMTASDALAQWKSFVGTP